MIRAELCPQGTPNHRDRAPTPEPTAFGSGPGLNGTRPPSAWPATSLLWGGRFPSCGLLERRRARRGCGAQGLLGGAGGGEGEDKQRARLRARLALPLFTSPTNICTLKHSEPRSSTAGGQAGGGLSFGGPPPIRGEGGKEGPDCLSAEAGGGCKTFLREAFAFTELAKVLAKRLFRGRVLGLRSWSQGSGRAAIALE